MANEILPFKALTESLAERFEVAPEELIATVKAACFPQGAASNAQLMMLLSFAKNYDLNPLARECYAFISAGRMSIGVQVDGWSKIKCRQQDFDGQDFDYESDDKGNTVAIVSKTYVKGRSHPTIYRAVMKEWKRNTDVWNSMPSHQLFVKAHNQGIRFAFGVPAYDPDDIERIQASRAIETTSTVVEARKENHAGVTPPEGERPLNARVAGETPAAGTTIETSAATPSAETPAPTGKSTAVPPTAAPVAPEPEKPKAASKSKVPPREHLDKLISTHVPAARLQLYLGQAGVASVNDLSDEGVVAMIAKIEARKGK